MNRGGMVVAFAAVAFAMCCSMPRLAAEGGDGLWLGDLVPAATPMRFVVGIDSSMLPMADSADPACPRIAEVAVFHNLEA